jgi:hypothetical protein
MTEFRNSTCPKAVSFSSVILEIAEFPVEEIQKT